MRTTSFVLACACLAQMVVFAGPRTPAAEFFAKHVDTSVPALAGIPASLEAGDLAGAEKIFAAHARASLVPEKLNKDWLARKYSPKDLRALTRRAKAQTEQQHWCGWRGPGGP